MSFYVNRKDHKYYKLVQEWLESYKGQESLLDIGSADTPVASWGESFKRRFSIDPRLQPELPNVRSIRGHWPDEAVKLPASIEVVTCLQVLEHIKDVQEFVDAIFKIATYRVIISVPHMWAKGRAPGHIHDPINRDTTKRWTRRKPLQSIIVSDNGCNRLVEEYQP